MTRAAALALLALAFLPLAAWLGVPGGPDHPGTAWLAWARATGLALAAGLVLAALHARIAARRPLPDPAAAWWHAGWRGDLLLGVLATVGYALLAHWLFDGRPAVIDEVVGLWQAEWLARGVMRPAAEAPPAFTLTPYTAVLGGRLIGQYPPGGPLLLAPFAAAGVPWLMGPLCGGGTVVAWARLVRRLAGTPGTALAAVLLLAASPFMAALGATQLAHVPTLALLLAGGAAFAAATADAAAHPRAAAGAGLAFGAAALLRPMEAAAFAVPAGAILAWRARGGGAHVVALLASGVGVAGMLALVALLNLLHTGDPLRFGYIAVWGPAHAPGFHEAPWGPPHTPAAGLAGTTGNLHALQRRLFEGPVPALLAPLVALWCWRRRLAPADRWLLLGSGLLVAGYWTYWHDGRWLGPRFHLPLVALAALWTARLPAALGGTAGRVAGWAVAVAVIGGGIVGVPREYARYRTLNAAVRTDVRAMLDSTSGVILVRDEPWRTAMAELRVRGMAAPRARRLATRNPCAARVLARAVPFDTATAVLPALSTADRVLCAEARGAEATGADATAAILLGTAPGRVVVRDRGAENLEWLDEATLRERTWVLAWAPGGRHGERPARVVRLDADSALADWARVRRLRAGALQ